MTKNERAENEQRIADKSWISLQHRIHKADIGDALEEIDRLHQMETLEDIRDARELAKQMTEDLIMLEVSLRELQNIERLEKKMK